MTLVLIIYVIDLQLLAKTNCLDWNTCIAFAVNFIKMGGLKNEVFFFLIASVLNLASHDGAESFHCGYLPCQ